MDSVHRVLDPQPVTSLAAYEAIGGGRGLMAAVEAGPEATLAVLDAAGLRGRGGAGFPTATKWRTVASYVSEELPATIVVNAAEGEPGTFKDRTILATNPYRVLEGALIAAVTLGADLVVVATKQRFSDEISRLRRAAEELRSVEWVPEVAIDIVPGPDEYLYGEETALLEVVAGRLPFPRTAPPWRRGVDSTDDEGASGAVADAELGSQNDTTAAAPTLVNNVETLANVALILANGEDWFRELGTDASPGTIVCTISGDTQRAGVVEVPMGTPLSAVIDAVGGGVDGGIGMVLPGVSSRILTGDELDVPLTYEDLDAADSSLGTAGFIVVAATVDPIAVAHGVARFLAVESCGQCTPCKDDGRRIAEALDRVRRRDAHGDELEQINRHLGTIEDGARCFLATQHRTMVASLLRRFSDDVQEDAASEGDEIVPFLVTELLDITPEGVATYDERRSQKQPDWSFDEQDSGQAPADRFQRVAISPR